MSDSFSILPVNSEVRSWLSTEGHKDLPPTDGRAATFKEIESAIAALPHVVVTWNTDSTFPDGLLETSSGLHTSLLINSKANANGFCEFHFRGGHEELIQQVAQSLSRLVGPLVIHAHSGSFTKVISAS